MFTRSSLAERLQDFVLRRKKQGKGELAILFGGIGAIGAAALFIPRGSSWVIAIPIITVLLLVAMLVIIVTNTKRAQRKAGLVCPSCAHTLDHDDVLHIALHDVCKYCNATISRS